MDLPFVRPQPVYHVGQLTFEQEGVVRALPGRMWDYENASLSVSLDPNAWATSSSSKNMYRVETPLKFVDADVTVSKFQNEIQVKASDMGLIQIVAGKIEPQEMLYDCLQAIGRIADGWELHACLSVLAAADDTVDGLWWSDVRNGQFPTPRGGIYQYRLVRHRIVHAQAPSDNPPTTEWLNSSILL